VNLHQRGQVLLNRVTKSETGTGVSVLYTRGATTAPLVITPATPDADASTQPSPTGRNQDKERFYFVVMADLTAAGLNEPQDGDRITEVIGGTPTVWEVSPRRTEPDTQWNTQRDRVRVRCSRKVLA
jgi:hypothetical protein